MENKSQQNTEPVKTNVKKINIPRPIGPISPAETKALEHLLNGETLPKIEQGKLPK